MVSQIFQTIAEVLEAYVGSITEMFGSLINIFYFENQLTLMGVLLLIGVSVSIVKWGFNLVRDLVRIG